MDLFEKRLNSSHESIQLEAIDQSTKETVKLLIDALTLYPNLYQTITTKIEQLSTFQEQFELVSSKLTEKYNTILLKFIYNSSFKSGNQQKSLDLAKLFPKSIPDLVLLTFSNPYIPLLKYLLETTETVKLSIIHLISTSQSKQIIEQFITTLETQKNKLNLTQAVSFNCLDTLYNSKMIDQKRYCHLLSCRITQIFIDNETIDEASFDRFKKCYISDMVLDNTLLVLLSLILLDFTNIKSVVDLLAVVLKNAIGNKSMVVPIVILCALNGVSVKEHRKKDQCYDQWVEILWLLEDYRLVKVDSDLNSKGLEGNLESSLYSTLVNFANSSQLYLVETVDILATVPALKTLVFSAAVFSAIDIENGYIHLCHYNDSIKKFRKKDALKVLMFYLYLLRVDKTVVSGVRAVQNVEQCVLPKINNRYQSFILLKSIPALTSLNDVFITTACLKITLQLLQPIPDTFLERIGLKTITAIHKHQPRIWNHIKIHLQKWANRFKNSILGGRVKPEIELKHEILLEKDMCELILYFCKKGHGEDLLPLVVSLLKAGVQEFGRTRDLSEIGMELMLKAFIVCIKNGATTAVVCWNVVLKQYYENLNSYDICYAVICDFFKYLGETVEGIFD
jgi:hypothetical protein